MRGGPVVSYYFLVAQDIETRTKSLENLGSLESLESLESLPVEVLTGSGPDSHTFYRVPFEQNPAPPAASSSARNLWRFGAESSSFWSGVPKAVSELPDMDI